MPARFQKCGEATFNYPYNNHSIGHDGPGIAVTFRWNVGHDAAESPVTMTWNTQPTIKIDDDVFKRLQAIAEPFTDTPNTVIRRLLDERVSTATLAAGTNSDRDSQVRGVEIDKTTEGRDLLAELDAEFGKKRRAVGLTPQPIYETFLLHVLGNTFGGRGEKHDVTKAVLDLMHSRGYVSHADLERVSTGETKAENTIAWARNALKEKGLISRISPRGVWELTPDGLKKAKNSPLPTKE